MNTSRSTHPPITLRRWTEQRWLLDNIIRSVGIDWDQPRLSGLPDCARALSEADHDGCPDQGDGTPLAGPLRRTIFQTRRAS